MLKHFRESDAFSVVNSQTFANEVFRLIADCNVLGEGKCASSDLLIGLLDLL